MKRWLFSFFFLVSAAAASAQQVLHFASLPSLLAFADTANSALKQSDLQVQLAHQTSVAAFGNQFNPRIPVTASAIDNTNLQVSFIPAEIFGGPAGTFREVQFGQQYITTLTVAPQVDILNPGKYAEARQAKFNEAVVNGQLRLTKKQLHEQLAAVYFNIMSFSAQVKVLERNAAMADSIALIVKNRYDAGVVKLQDWNDGRVNALDAVGKCKVANQNLKLQYLTLSSLCETTSEIVLDEELTQTQVQEALANKSDLTFANAQAQYAYARQQYKTNWWNNAPTLTFVSSWNSQNNSNAQFFDNNQRWINSTYLGLRMSWDLPTNVTKLASLGNANISMKIAQEQLRHAELNKSIAAQNLQTELVKAQEDWKVAVEIETLESDTFGHNLELYKQEVLGLDKLLLAQQKMLNAQLNNAVKKSTACYRASLIQIHNQFQ
jgi:OMF family outer membrane factor